MKRSASRERAWSAVSICGTVTEITSILKSGSSATAVAEQTRQPVPDRSETIRQARALASGDEGPWVAEILADLGFVPELAARKSPAEAPHMAT
jgi:hypothetical protein